MRLDDVVDGLKKGGSLVCTRCHKNLNKEEWGSEWADHQHYKSFMCACGKKNWIKADFIGSGHDHVLQDKDQKIESVMDKVAQK